MNQSDFARLMKVTPKTVSIWKSRGRIVMVDDLVDVEGSRRRILQFARSRSKALAGAKRLGNMNAELLPNAFPISDEGNDGQPARYADGAVYDNPANLPEAPVSASSAIAEGAYDLVAVLLGRLPMAEICEVVCQWTVKQRASWVGGPGLRISIAEEEGWPPAPIGCAGWWDHRLFVRDPVKEVDWLSLAEAFPEHAASMPL